MAAGLIGLVAGLVARSCLMVNNELAGAWCGAPPSAWIEAQSTGHCAGCALALIGAATMLAGAGQAALRTLPAKRERTIRF